MQNWFKKIFILILIIFTILPLFYLKQDSYADNVIQVNSVNQQIMGIKENQNNIVELYNIESTTANDLLDKIFKLELNNKTSILSVKEKQEMVNNCLETRSQIFLDGKELMNSYEGLKEIWLWKPYNIAVVRFWGGQSVYNYFFDLNNEGKIIPIISDGQKYNFIGSAGGSEFGEIPLWGKIFVVYYKNLGYARISRLV